jgi:AraC-like DNA-binding protein
VDVAAFLTPQLLTHLRIVLGREHTLIEASGWNELHAVVRQRSLDLVVADPVADGRLQVAELEQVVRHYPSVPVVVYTVLSASTARALVPLARSGVEHVVLNRFDDEPRRFLDLLERVPGHALSDQLMQALAEPLGRLPVMVVRAIEQAIRTPSRFHNAQDLASAAGMNTRTLYRNLEAAELGSARMIVVGARLLRAYSLLRDPGRSIKEIASRLGYHSPWQLTQQMREITGLTPRLVRRRLEADAFVARLAGEIRGRRDNVA